MNLRLNPEALTVPPDRANARRPSRQDRRQNAANEVMAGFLWMSLDLPEDIGLDEIMQLAIDLTQRIRAGSDETLIVAQLHYIQRHQLCRPVDPQRLLAMARRAVTLAATP